MRYPGIERRKKLKDEIAFFPIMVKIHKGEKVEKATNRKKAGKEHHSDA